MLMSTVKWPIWFWNIFSIFSIDSYYNKWQVIYSIVLMISCVYNIYNTPKTTCIVERACDSSFSAIAKGLFTRVVAFNCLMSRMVIFFKGRTNLILYSKQLEKFHVLTPMTSFETEMLKKVSCRLVMCCFLLTIPVNILRLVQILGLKSTHAMVSFILMYIQNFCTYCVETHFIVLGFVLHQKLVSINRDLMALKIDTDARNKYPLVLQTEEHYGKNNYAIDYNTEVLHSLADGHPMIDFLEKLKFKHKLVREAVNNLNDMFGVQLGLSMCSICFYGFNLYFYMVDIDSEKYEVLTYAWILQYAVRFGTVAILGNLTTQQVVKSKILITDINNRFLDNNTKEELQLLNNQLCSSAIEYTACDFFTINNHLISSAIAAGLTCITIFMNFK